MTPDTSHPRHRTLSRLSIKSICLIVDKKQCFVTRVSKEESEFVYIFNTNKLHKLVLLLSEFKFLWLISILNVFCRIYHHYYYFSWILRMYVFSSVWMSHFTVSKSHPQTKKTLSDETKTVELFHVNFEIPKAQISLDNEVGFW